METKIKLLVFGVLCLATVKLNAQTTYTGCVIYEGAGTPRTYTPIYTSGTGVSEQCNGYTVEVYNSTPSSAPLDAYCSISPPLDNASPALKRDCRIGSNGPCGLIKTITVYDCPIDSYVLPLILIIACFTGYFIRTQWFSMRTPSYF